MDKEKIIVLKTDDLIVISYEGKRLIINDVLFNALKGKTINEIKEWYLKR